ncbi:ATP-dependent RNA helicase Prh1 [Desarmillaria tabescens]|uniref:RNA helicase n=1 Tax=Armillaria tabescens TaxID=1929756 RepID=A0AA39N9C9_ARMTA|nr:ATP-dependent RNA helicase Prh1 [Desarmillaria tabescens]KAK0461432.1 ATP-dependent RNA helicase Prh1 [Desarmillaria tabescens]
MDVSDDEDRPRKTPLKVHGVLSNGQKRVQTNGRKRLRISQNGCATSMPPSTIQEQRNSLPIAKGKAAIIEEIRNNDVTVLIGETGSGKTTQVPQYILESGLAGGGLIAVTQPRRVAATSLATRVAVEQNTTVGRLVGYSVRFDERSSPSTRIKYLTDGMIVRELLADPLLTKYSVVIVDEAHERTLRTDLLLSHLKSIQKQRVSSTNGKGKGKERETSNCQLKIVIMSATLDAEKFSKYFTEAKILYVKGRQHPVKIYHSAMDQMDYLDAALRTFFQIHMDQPPGDVLVFLPGQEDIESLEKSIESLNRRLPPGRMEVLVCSMYAAQAPGQNAKAFSPPPSNTRKCILATNIAETSITIPGVKYVIDTGKCKEKRYLTSDTGGGLDTLLTRDITQSSAMQRTGRAGRERLHSAINRGWGIVIDCIRKPHLKTCLCLRKPEILRCGLTSSLLQLRCIGQELENLDLMDRPEEDSSKCTHDVLFSLLMALTGRKSLHKVGRNMAAFPLEPIHARAILASKDYGCTSEILSIISILSASSKLYIDNSEQRETIIDSRRKFRHPSGDHLTLLNVSKASRKEWCKKHFLNERTLLEAKEIRAQLKQVCVRVDVDPNVSCGEEEPILKSLGHGLVQNSAFLQPDGSYKQTMGPSIVKIHPGSSMFEKKVPALIYDELIYTNHIYARGVSSIPKGFFQTLGALNQRTA